MYLLDNLNNRLKEEVLTPDELKTLQYQKGIISFERNGRPFNISMENQQFVLKK